MIRINDQVHVDEDEFQFQTARSGGPGGQNVNKVNTRVILRYDIPASKSLTDPEKTLLLRRLGRRLNKQGVLRLVNQQHRSQSRNKTQVIQTFVELLRETLRPRTPRKKTKVPPAAKRRRSAEKQQRSRLKQQRRYRPAED